MSFLIFVLMVAVPLIEAAEVPAALSGLADDVRQAVLVEAEPGRVTAQVSGWERHAGQWVRVIGPVDAVVGRNGLAPVGAKREGDGRTPSGVFALRRAFGYAPAVRTRLDYRQVTDRDFWIDAPASPEYNQWVRGGTPAVSHEALRRPDDLYRYAVVVEYNTDPVVSGGGSAIFIHVWRAPGQPTAGCVAMARKHLLEFLVWLDATEAPAAVLAEGTR